MTKLHGMLEGGKCAKKKKVEAGSRNDGARVLVLSRTKTWRK